MHLSAWVYATDLLPLKRSFTEKLVHSKSLFRKYSIEEVFQKLKAAGVDGIELLIPVNFSEEDFKQIQAILNKNSVVVNSIHQPLRWITKTNVSEIKMLFSVAKKFNAKVIVLHLYNAKEQIFNNSYLEKLHNLQKEFGIKIAFENTQKFAQVFNQKIYWDSKMFSEIVKKAGFSITFDTTHLANTGGDIIPFFNENKDNIVNIQLSDYRVRFLKPSLHLPLGKGTLPVKEFLQILKENNYQNYITLEIKGDLEELCESALLIKKIIN
jgi:sugar phosphate isomerase/epimerase